jgi:hypothetical protein
MVTDIKVRVHNILPNGWKIFQCQRSLGSNNICYDKDEKVITANQHSMNVKKSRHPRAGGLVAAMGGYFDFSTCFASNMVELVEILVLPTNDPVAVNSPTHATLKIRDILLCPPTSASQRLWKAATLPDVVAAREKAIQEGKKFYMIYFAQSPDGQDADETTTATTLTTTPTATNSLTNHSTAATSTPTIHDQHPHRTSTSISTAPHSSNNDDNNNHDRLESAEPPASPTASNGTAPPPPQQQEEMICHEVLDEDKDKAIAAAAAPTAVNKVPPNSVGGTTPLHNPMSDAAAKAAAEEEEPLPMLTQDHAPPIVAAPRASTAAAATLMLPDLVPSESVPLEQVSSSVDVAMTTTTKRRTSGKGGKKKKRRKQQRQEVNVGSDDEEEDDDEEDDRSAVPQLPANAYDTLTQKLRNDVLWQQASTKYEQAQSLLGKCQDLWTTTQQQQQQQQQEHQLALDPPITVLHSYVLPAVPAKVAPPPATTDYLILIHRVGEYTMALSEHSTKLETYNAAMEAWTMRMDQAAQHWFDQSERRDQSRLARQAADDKVLVARVASQRAQVHEADAQRAEQQALAALLASTTS